MNESQVHITFADAISAAGNDRDQAKITFQHGLQPFAIPDYFHGHRIPHGLCPELQPQPGDSRALTLANQLCNRLPTLPENTNIYLATTVGAIDRLEQARGEETPDAITLLQNAIERRFPSHPVTMIAAACASSQVAVAAARRALRQRRCQQALVIGLDIVSEFVTSGFVSLGAVSRCHSTRPYDANRDGLLLGEGAGALLLSLAPGPHSLGKLIAGGESGDAAHITAPDLSGAQLSALITTTLRRANRNPHEIGGILGHGTGTMYNDQSELAALNQVFGAVSRTPPLVSIKGNTGHTLAASGILQIIYGLDFLSQAQMPPQAGLQTPAPGAEKFVASRPQAIASPCLLSLNIGFGGLNSVLLLEGGES